MLKRGSNQINELVHWTSKQIFLLVQKFTSLSGVIMRFTNDLLIKPKYSTKNVQFAPNRLPHLPINSGINIIFRKSILQVPDTGTSQYW